MFDNLQLTLADVVGSTPDLHLDEPDDYLWWGDYDYDNDNDEDDRPAYYHGVSMDDDEAPEPEPEPEPDDPDEVILPLIQSVSVVHYSRWYSKREKNRCRRVDNSKPKGKEHRPVMGFNRDHRGRIYGS